MKRKSKKIDTPMTEEEMGIIRTSLYINPRTKMIAEQVYGEEEDVIEFCVYNTETEDIKYWREIKEGDFTYMPIEDEEVRKKAILLPSKVEEYGTDKKLEEDIKNFINKWLDINEDVLQFAVWNIKRSWVYERFHTLNYLRALGDTGQGKSRFLDTLGYIHYKPIATSGATTVAPIFRIIDKWRGTLIMDEADMRKSDEAEDMIKIINQGYEVGRYVMRCDKENKNRVNFFDPFCPKILATRKTFHDKAVESRCITQVMTGTIRKDIKWNLNKEFWDEALHLRNKLLLWRLKNYYKIDPDKEIDFDLGDIEPRVQQIVNSFVTLFSENKKQLDSFKEFIKRYQEELIEERQNSWDGTIVGGIHQLLNNGMTEITATDIINTKQITNNKGAFINPRSLSSSLRSLGFNKLKPKKVEGKTKKCIPLERNHLEQLFKRYGYQVTVVTVLGGTRKLTETSNLEGSRGISNNGNNGNPVTEEEQIQQIIHHHCSICGHTESHYWNERGKPICKDCKGAKDSQGALK